MATEQELREMLRTSAPGQQISTKPITPEDIILLLQNGQIDQAAAILALAELYTTRGTDPGLAAEIARTEVQKAMTDISGQTAPLGGWPSTAPGLEEDFGVAVATPVPAPAGGYFDPRDAQVIAREQASKTFAGRQNIFGGFMQAQPGYGQYNPLVQAGMASALGPLSAQFGLQTATSPYWEGAGALAGVPSGPTPLDFREFLKGTPQRWGQQEWINQLAPLGEAFNALGTEEGPTGDQYRLMDLYSDPAAQNRLMSAVVGQTVSPYMRRFVPGSIASKRLAMFETDPSLDVFKQFVGSPGTWGR